MEKGNKIQDEARSYRSKVGAARLVLKNEMTRAEFKKFIEKEGGNEAGRTEFVTYFETLDQLKMLPREEQIARLKKLLTLTPAPSDGGAKNNNQINSTLWSCLRPLRALALDKATQLEITKAVGSTQDMLLSPVTPEFERFMESPEFAECKRNNLENNKNIARKPPPPVALNKAPVGKGTTIVNQKKENSTSFMGIM